MNKKCVEKEKFQWIEKILSGFSKKSLYGPKHGKTRQGFFTHSVGVAIKVKLVYAKIKSEPWVSHSNRSCKFLSITSFDKNGNKETPGVFPFIPF